MIVCASLEPRNAVESIQALRFGEACSRVETRAIGGADGGAAALTALVAESYKRAYTSMVSVQLISEIEEIVEFKKLQKLILILQMITY